MNDCQDDDAKPEGSIADLREDLTSLSESFSAEAETNRTDRAEGEPVEPSQDPTADIPADKQDPFNPQPVLLMTHAGGDEQRPLPRRSETQGQMVPPLRSESVSIDADVVEAGGSYEVEVTVRNVGGLPARKVDVELYAEHTLPDARVDTPGDDVFELAEGYYHLPAGAPNYGIDGVTTLAPDSQVSMFTHMDDSGPPFEKVLGYNRDQHVSADRTFSGQITGKPPEFLDGSPVPDDRTEFTLEVWDTTHTPTNKVGPAKEGESFFEAPEQWHGVRLASVPGEYVETPRSTFDREDQFLTGTVESSTTQRVGKQAVSIPGGNATTLSFSFAPAKTDFPLPKGDAGNVTGSEEWIPSDVGPGIGRGVTALYARVYSLATAELPDDWSALDHTTSRFVARTEVPRRT